MAADLVSYSGSDFAPIRTGVRTDYVAQEPPQADQPLSSSQLQTACFYPVLALPVLAAFARRFP